MPAPPVAPAPHAWQLLCLCLSLLGAVPAFTLYASVRLVLPACSGSVLNVFVASEADALISFSKVLHVSRANCSSSHPTSGVFVRFCHCWLCCRPLRLFLADHGTSTRLLPLCMRGPVTALLQLPRSGVAVLDFEQSPVSAVLLLLPVLSSETHAQHVAHFLKRGEEYQCLLRQLL
jgi:hypothetical protein